MSGRCALRVRDDQLTKRADSSRIDMGNDSANRHLRNELTKCVELRSALSPVQQPVHVGILNQFEKRLASTHCFYSRRIGLCDTGSEVVHRAYHTPLLLEFRIPAIQRQKKLIPSGCQARQRVWGAKQFLYRVRPQTNARITRFNLKFSMLFDEGSYVFTQDGDSSQREGRGRRRLAGLALAAQRDCPSPDTYGAGMECQDTAASQNKSHDRPQEIGRQILIGERRQTSSPNTLRRTIYEK